MLKYLKKRAEYNFFVKNAPQAFLRFYKLIDGSSAYKKYNKALTGLDIPLLNNATSSQLTELSKYLEGKNEILDLGCGNGELAKSFGARGIDIAFKSSNVKKGNFETLEFPKNLDVIYSIDSMYMLKDCKKLIEKILLSLKPGGIFITLYTSKESFEKSDLFKALKNKNYEAKDFSKDQDEYWKLNSKVLNELKEDFYKEGNQALYQMRLKEIENNTKNPLQKRSMVVLKNE